MAFYETAEDLLPPATFRKTVRLSGGRRSLSRSAIDFPFRALLEKVVQVPNVHCIRRRMTVACGTCSRNFPVARSFPSGVQSAVYSYQASFIARKPAGTSQPLRIGNLNCSQRLENAAKCFECIRTGKIKSNLFQTKMNLEFSPDFAREAAKTVGIC